MTDDVAGRGEVRARRPVRAALAFAAVSLLLGAPAALAYEASDVRAFGAACDGKTDDTVALKNAIAARAGASVTIDDACTLLIATPGEGDPSAPCGAPASGCSFVLPSGTRVKGIAGGATIKLSGRTCRGGRYVGAACTGDAQCLGGGTCAYDAGLASVYAPTPTKRYYVFTAATGAVDVGIEGLRIETRQMDPYFRCSGGTHDGAPCRHVCAGNATLSCDADADCATWKAGTCEHLADCKTAAAPGVCGGPSDGANAGPAYEPGAPAGAGNIVPIDLSNAASSTIRDVIVIDHRHGPVGVKIDTGLVEHVDVTRWTTIYPIDLHSASPWAWPIPAVTDGIVATGANAIVTGSTANGTSSGITIDGTSGKIIASTVGIAHAYDVPAYGAVLGPGGVAASITGLSATIGGFGSKLSQAGVLFGADGQALSDSTITGPSTAATLCMTATGLCIAGVELASGLGQARIENVQFGSGMGALTRGVVTTSPIGVLNAMITRSRFSNVQGAAIAYSGSGLAAEGNYYNGGVYLSCGTSCANRGWGCVKDGDCKSCDSGDACVPEPVIALGSPFSASLPGVTHPTISGSVPLYRNSALKQCTGAGGSGCGGGNGEAGCVCSANDDCASRACTATTIDLIKVGGFGTTRAGVFDGTIENNLVLFGNVTSPMRFLDLSALAFGSTRVDGLKVGGNTVNLMAGAAPSTGIAFPSTASSVSGFDGRGNTWDAGAGSAALTSVSNFAWSMGLIDDLPEPSADHVNLLRLTNKTGATATVGDAVVADTTTANAVRQAPASTAAPILGVFLTAAPDDAIAKVAGPGSVVTVNVRRGEGASYGDRLSMSSTAGLFAKSHGAAAWAIALGSQSGTTVRALLMPVPAEVPNRLTTAPSGGLRGR